MGPFDALNHLGIGQAAALRDKVAAWARVVDARPEPLWACLDALAALETQQIVDDALAAPGDGTSIAEPASMPG